MAYIQRANVVLQVKDSEVDYYVNLGYNEITRDGKIIRESIPNDVGVLQKHYKESKAKIAELEAEIIRLKAEKEVAKPVEEVKEVKTRGRKKASE